MPTVHRARTVSSDTTVAPTISNPTVAGLIRFLVRACGRANRRSSRRLPLRPRSIRSPTSMRATDTQLRSRSRIPFPQRSRPALRSSCSWVGRAFRFRTIHLGYSASLRILSSILCSIPSPAVLSGFLLSHWVSLVVSVAMGLYYNKLPVATVSRILCTSL